MKHRPQYSGDGQGHNHALGILNEDDLPTRFYIPGAGAGVAPGLEPGAAGGTIPGVADGTGVAPGAGLGLGLAAVTPALPVVEVPAEPVTPVGRTIPVVGARALFTPVALLVLGA